MRRFFDYVQEAKLHRASWGYEFSGTVREMMDFLAKQPPDAEGIVSVELPSNAVQPGEHGRGDLVDRL